jgi:streptogramin lyase
LWILDRQDATVTAVGAGDHRMLGRVALHVPRGGPGRRLDPWTLAAGAGGVWVTDGSSRLRVIDPATGRLRAVDEGRPLTAAAATAREVWAISAADASALRINPRTARVGLRVPIVARPGYRSPTPSDLAIGFGAVWVLNANMGTLSRIDPRMRGVTATVRVAPDDVATQIAAGAGRVWVAGTDGTLTEVDPRSGKVAAVHTVARSLVDVAVAAGRVWVTTGRDPPAPGS